MMLRRGLALLAFGAGLVVLAGSARADTIDFSGPVHGAQITTQFSGVTISAQNTTRGLTIAAIFDTTKTSTADPDLEDPFSSAGNLAGSTFMGNALILAENNTDANGDGVLDDPDDEGARSSSGNWIKFAFDAGLTDIGWDVIDLERASSEQSSVLFTDSGGAQTTLQWDNGTSGDLQSLFGLGYGDNSLNRIGAISASFLGLDDILSVQFNIGGSMALDNLRFTTSVPEPGTLALLACGLAGLAFHRRRR